MRGAHAENIQTRGHASLRKWLLSLGRDIRLYGTGNHLNRSWLGPCKKLQPRFLRGDAVLTCLKNPWLTQAKVKVRESEEHHRKFLETSATAPYTRPMQRCLQERGNAQPVVLGSLCPSHIAAQLASNRTLSAEILRVWFRTIPQWCHCSLDNVESRACGDGGNKEPKVPAVCQAIRGWPMFLRGTGGPQENS